MIVWSRVHAGESFTSGLGGGDGGGGSGGGGLGGGGLGGCTHKTRQCWDKADSRDTRIDQLLKNHAGKSATGGLGGGDGGGGSGSGGLGRGGLGGCTHKTCQCWDKAES